MLNKIASFLFSTFGTYQPTSKGRPAVRQRIPRKESEMDKFIRMGHIASRFCGKSDGRKALTGVYVDEGRLWATNGYQLIKLNTSLLFKDTLIPGAVFKELRDTPIKSIKFSPDKKTIIFNGCKKYPLMTESYPAVAELLPKSHKFEFLINRAELIRIAAQAMKSANPKTREMAFVPRGVGKMLTVHAGTFKAQIPYSGDMLPVPFGFNGRYLQQVVRTMEGPVLRIRANGPTGAFAIESAQRKAVFMLLMPIRVNTDAFPARSQIAA